MIKRNSKTSAPVGAQDEPGFKENPQINARIDEYIKQNPKQWEYIQAMPRERLERGMVLDRIQRNDRREKMHEGVLNKLDQNPEMKQHIEGLVKHLPEDQREGAMVAIAARTMRALKPKQEQGQAQGISASV
jgi:hypothetical protein